PKVGGGPPVVPTRLRVLSGALRVTATSAEEGGKSLGRLFLGDALLFLLFLFLLLALAFLLLGRRGGGRRGGEGLGLRENVGEVDALHRGEQGLDPRRVRLDAGGRQDPGQGLLIDRLSGGVQQQRSVNVLHRSHSVNFGGTFLGTCDLSDRH